MQEIVRLEDLETLEKISLSHLENGDWDGRRSIEASASRSVICLASANVFVKSLDRPKDFPPPTKVIT
jgi:hypothetical protein